MTGKGISSKSSSRTGPVSCAKRTTMLSWNALTSRAIFSAFPSCRSVASRSKHPWLLNWRSSKLQHMRVFTPISTSGSPTCLEFVSSARPLLGRDALRRVHSLGRPLSAPRSSLPVPPCRSFSLLSSVLHRFAPRSPRPLRPPCVAACPGSDIGMVQFGRRSCLLSATSCLLSFVFRRFAPRSTFPSLTPLNPGGEHW